MLFCEKFYIVIYKFLTDFSVTNMLDRCFLMINGESFVTGLDMSCDSMTMKYRTVDVFEGGGGGG